MLINNNQSTFLKIFRSKIILLFRKTFFKIEGEMKSDCIILKKYIDILIIITKPNKYVK